MQLAEIRRLERIVASDAALRISTKQLAARLGVSPKTVARVLEGLTYKGEGFTNEYPHDGGPGDGESLL